MNHSESSLFPVITRVRAVQNILGWTAAEALGGAITMRLIAERAHSTAAYNASLLSLAVTVIAAFEWSENVIEESRLRDMAVEQLVREAGHAG